MRHVKRLLTWSNGDGSELLFLTVRGFVTVLKPKGLTGIAQTQVLSFIQKVAPALWPEKVVPSAEEATVFLESLPFPTSSNSDDCPELPVPEIPHQLSKASNASLSDTNLAEPGSPDAQRDASQSRDMSPAQRLSLHEVVE